MLFGVSSLDKNINLATSIILFGVLGVLHGVTRPFKIIYKSYQELILIFNLQTLYALSLCSKDGNNITIVNIMIIMAALQFILIISYHGITYVSDGLIRKRIQLSANKLTEWITRLHSKSQPQQFQLQGSIRDNIPEVAFNYHEYREPLVGQD